MYVMWTHKVYELSNVNGHSSNFTYFSLRGKPEDLLRTKPNIPGQSMSTTRQAAPHQPGLQQSTTSKPGTTRVGTSKPSKSAVVASKDFLHSTALNTTLMADMANGKNNSVLRYN